MSRARHLLGALSQKVPPAIIRPEIGRPITREEIAPLFEGYVAAFCTRWEAERVRITDPVAALDVSRMAATAERDRMMAVLSEGGVARTASPSLVTYVAERANVDRDKPCAVHALVDLLRACPEAEPGSYLAAVARDPPGASLLVQCAAVDAMGQTGRADYVTELERYVTPGLDSRVVYRAIDASTTILGDAELATKLLHDEFSFDEQLAAGLAHALSIADGPAVVRVVEGLASSREPNRRLAAFQAAAIGAGLPDALDALVDAARAAGTTRHEAARLVDSIQYVGGPAAPRQLLSLAGDRAFPATTRGVALLHAEPSRDGAALAREIAGATTDVDLAIALARVAYEVSPEIANEILDAFARNPTLESELARELRGATNGSFLALAASYFDHADSQETSSTER